MLVVKAFPSQVPSISNLRRDFSYFQKIWNLIRCETPRGTINKVIDFYKRGASSVLLELVNNPDCANLKSGEYAIFKCKERKALALGVGMGNLVIYETSPFTGDLDNRSRVSFLASDELKAMLISVFDWPEDRSWKILTTEQQYSILGAWDPVHRNLPNNLGHRLEYLRQVLSVLV